MLLDEFFSALVLSKRLQLLIHIILLLLQVDLLGFQFINLLRFVCSLGDFLLLFVQDDGFLDTFGAVFGYVLPVGEIVERDDLLRDAVAVLLQRESSDEGHGEELNFGRLVAVGGVVTGVSAFGESGNSRERVGGFRLKFTWEMLNMFEVTSYKGHAMFCL